jgi:exodeoxyribonuclease VII large subunit
LSRKVTHDGQGNLEVRFPFHRRLVDLVKTLPGRRWNPDGKYWSLPDDHVLETVEMLHPEGFGFCETTRRLYVDHGGTVPLEPGPPPPSRQADLFGDPPVESPGPASTADPDDYTVLRLNEEVRAVLSRAFPDAVWLVGEISGFNKNAHKRHVSFQLAERDEAGKTLAEVGATLFERDKREIRRRLKAAGDPFALEDEITVRVRARIELYVPWGSYRVIVDDLDINYTLGEAARRREEIIRKLTEEGLVDVNRSLTFPEVPLRVGVITSLKSDAHNDVMQTLRESSFAFRVTVHGARVQGQQTEPSVLNALDWFRERSDDFDVVLVCRGGGSRIDLGWFDSENLGRAVARFPLPVIVGIGHERDFSVLDAVGWRRKTPTAAAAFLVEAVQTFVDRVEECGRVVLDLASRRIDAEARVGSDRAARLAMAAGNLLDRGWVTIAHQRDRVGRAADVLLRQARDDLARRASGIPLAAARHLGRRAEALEQASRQLAQGATRDLSEAARRTSRLAGLFRPATLRRIELETERIEARDRRLALVHPRRVLDRGYAILRTEGDGVLTDAGDAPAGSAVTAELRRGALRLRSEGKRKER